METVRTKYSDEFLDEKFRALREAVDKQFIENERRLEILNHEAEKLNAMKETYIPREVFDRTISEIRDFRNNSLTDLNKKIETLTTWKDQQSTSSELIKSMDTRISILSDWRARTEGRDQFIKFVFGVIIAASAILSCAAFFKH